MRFWRYLVLAFFAICIALPVFPAWTQGDSDLNCTVSAGNNVNRRMGPSTDYEVIGILAGGEASRADGQDTGTDGHIWWHLLSLGWVRSDVVNAVGECDSLPILDIESIVAFEEGAKSFQEEDWEAALVSLEVALQGFRNANDRTYEGHTLLWIGSAQQEMMRYADALATLEAALPLLQESGLSAYEGSALFHIAENYQQLGYNSLALDYAQQALVIHQELGDRRAEAGILSSLTAIYLAMEEYDLAQESITQALGISQELGDPILYTRLQRGLGTVFHARGDYMGALFIYQNLVLEYQIRAGYWLEVAITLQNCGESYRAMGRYDQALQDYQSALDVIRYSNNPTLEGITLMSMGVLYLEQEDTDRALDYYQRALAAFRQGGEHNLIINVQRKIAALHHANGQIELARQAWQSALTVARENGNWKGEADTLRDMAVASASLEEALESYQGALEIYQVQRYPPGEAEVLHSIGRIYESMGQFDQAQEHFQQALAITRELGLQEPAATALMALGNSYAAQRQYPQALDVFHQALDIYQALNNRAGEGAILANIGIVYTVQREVDQGLHYYQQALDITRDVGDSSQELRILINIAMAYVLSDQPEVALTYYEQTLRLAQQSGERGNEVASLTGIGAIRAFQGDYDRALADLQQSLEISREIGDRVHEANALHNLGRVFYLQGQYDLALTNYQDSLTIMQETGGSINEMQVLHGLAEVLEAMGQFEQAIDYYEQAVELLETIHSQIRLESGQVGFSREFQGVWPYDRLVTLLADSDPEESFRYAERGRAKAFLFQLSNERIPFGAGAEAELLDEWQATQDQISVLRERRVELTSQLIPDAAAIAALDNDFSEAEQNLSLLEDQIAISNPLLGQLTGVTVPDLPDVQASISADTTLLSYYITDQEVFVFVLTASGFEVLRLDPTPHELSEAVATFRLDEQNQTAPLVQLHEWLIAPLSEYLNTANLVVAPYGVLNYIPFAALMTEDGHLLAEDYTISYIPSATVYSLLMQTQTAYDTEGTYLVLGNPETTSQTAPLRFAEQEAALVAEILGAEALLGTDATETILRTRIGQADVLHVAAHASFNTNNALFSFLSLAPDDQHDGLLEVREVYTLPLREQAPLVVLSACQTAVGDLSEGDEFQGLTRAFLLSGARAVVASLWAVDDEATAVLMEYFYRNRDAGLSDALALTEAQRAVREDPDHEEWASPYYWSAFVLTGRG